MKKLSTTLLAVAIASVAFLTACEEAEQIISVIGIELNQTSATMTVGTTLTLVPNVSPANASNPALRWISSDSTVASVANGTITAIAPGNANIMAISIDGGLIATCAVTVIPETAPNVPVTNVSLNSTGGLLTVGKSAMLIATVWPENATNQTVTWTSNNPAVASVVNGLVTAISAGTATITVTTEDGNFTATFTVAINAATPDIPDISVTGVSLNWTDGGLWVGENLTLIATVWPENATNQTVTWASNNPAVASVVNGLVTAISAGTATITVTTEDGNFTATFMVVINAAAADISVTGVSLNQTSATLEVGQNFTLTATIFPENATNQNLTWTSSDNTIATVANGVVTAISAGTATITVTTQDGNLTATSVVTVNPAIVPVTGVTLNQTTATLTAGENITLTATVLPANATNRNVTWTSNNTSVATVNNNGVVTAVSVGTATITVATEDGNFTATSAIVVTRPAPRGCSNNALYFYLGTPYFATSQTWIVGTGSASQEWSDAVRAPGCDKTFFSGLGTYPYYNANCRRPTNGFDGHYFTWCMVMRFADQLCPYPWRVPTAFDFQRLLAIFDNPFSGLGTLHYMGFPPSGTTINRGGSWGGAAWTGHATNLTVQSSGYWSYGVSNMNLNNRTTVYRLAFGQQIAPIVTFTNFLDNGWALRCIRR